MPPGTFTLAHITHFFKFGEPFRNTYFFEGIPVRPASLGDHSGAYSHRATSEWHHSFPLYGVRTTLAESSSRARITSLNAKLALRKNAL